MKNQIRDLSVVVPVFNEALNINQLVRDWYHVFTELKISFRFILINDGSTDDSLTIMKQLAEELPEIFIISQPNKGHGPAIIKGYHEAINSPWVLQIDADHQFETSAFAELWSRRNDHDLLIAERQQKKASIFRDIISSSSTLIVHVLYGRGIDDVNCPYRLIRSSILKQALDKINRDSFAPNVLITSFFIRSKKRLYRMKVSFRATGKIKKSKMNLYFLKGCLKSIIEVIRFRFTYEK